ncbi:MAG: Omp28 family outer membrane lipoprotein [Muribaculaceae bacterium]|nr:Omp28 family outer membrane lipoprotein [Muribaculaceae bacterium]MBR5118231.1 Omp28 family outer membrane lipoprotein [Muribaculaceae bacterium]
MKIKAYITLFVVALLMAACSNIDEDERLIYVKPAPVERCVLVEDFTGQRCVNCPTASLELEKLIEQYGEDAIIAVSIHSGPLGFHTNPRFYGLSTDVGDTLYTHWGFDFQPVGLIDRGSPAEFTSWGTLIREELQKTAPVEIDLGVAYDDSLQLSINTQVKSVDGNIQGKLQVWVVEDSVTAFQMMPDGTRNDTYTHRHVFRATVNGLWGDDITVQEGYAIDKEYTFPIDVEWKIENLSVIAFVYNESGVLQVTKAKLQNADSVEE